MFTFRNKAKGASENTDDDTEQIHVAPGTEIAYKKSLIEKYRREHCELQGLFTKALTAWQLGDDPALLQKLRDLQIGLRRHLLDEEVNLYIYLRHDYSHDKVKQELITKFKSCSKKTGLAAFGFIRKVTQEKSNVPHDEAFLSELLEIGNMLETLIEAEEAQLYPIYRRPATRAEQRP